MQYRGFEFITEFLIDDVVVNEQEFLPGAMNGKNNGVCYSVFTGKGEHTVRIRGKNTKQLKVVVKKP